jgi:hypothetical protein
MPTQTLSFYTTGEDMTNLIYSFLNDGNFKTFFQIMDDSGIDEEYVKLFFKGCVELKGDTRKDGLLLSTPEKPHKVDLKTAVLTWLSSSDEYKEDGDVRFDSIYAGDWKPEHERLKKLLGNDYIPKTFNTRQNHLFSKIGYTVLNEMPKDRKVVNGIVIEDGTFIQCPAYGHSSLKTELVAMGYDESQFLNISYNEIYGELITLICHNKLDKINHKNVLKQFKTLKKFPIIRDKYTYESAYKLLNSYFIEHYGNGGKYGSLKFIDELYGFNVPEISTSYFKGAGFVRSSPEKSLPGLLESYRIEDEQQVSEIIEKMKSDYNNYENIVKWNSFNYFFQEFVEGKTGVAHYTTDRVFSYDLSNKNYDVVEGKSGGERLSANVEKELELMMHELHVDFGFNYDIQLEFCVNEKGEIVVLQFRTFEVEKEEIKIPEINGEILCEGIAFNQGVVENIYGKEILVVDQDATPSQLIGKKALVVTGDGQYSHVLSLSRVMNIPSIYKTGNVEVDELKTYSVVSNKEISKLIKL